MPTTATTTIGMCKNPGHVNGTMDDEANVGKFAVFPTGSLGNLPKKGHRTIFTFVLTPFAWTIKPLIVKR
ncbi:hypothetical protein GCM10011511_52890 [Puia dinghuensis]|uniref:Uncharacterized protein n=1 Tax=Puia dinghuensis TaxID=1792502 RepID=A0A8J2UIW8_9BACT|nr:hypothetical protein GCM10011511_52890 [Puia dinghuensis]